MAKTQPRPQGFSLKKKVGENNGFLAGVSLSLSSRAPILSRLNPPFPSFSTPATQAKSQILAGKSQSFNEGEKTWPSKDPACNLQNLLDDSFFRDRVHQIH